MNGSLLVAGSIFLVLAVGHALTGAFLLPSLSQDTVSRTPFGPADMSVGMLRFSWHVVTTVLIALSALLITLAWDSPDTRTLVLRGLTVWSCAAAGLALSIAGRTPRYLLRLPGPVIVLQLVVAVLCWIATV